jgi:hypothetical protein
MSHLIYKLSRTALLETARRLSKQWDTATEDAWNTIHGRVIGRIVKFSELLKTDAC